MADHCDTSTLREKIARNPRDIESRFALGTALRDASDHWGSLVETYRAHLLNRRREDIVQAMRDSAETTPILPEMRATLRSALAGEAAADAMPAQNLAQLDRDQRLDLFRTIFEICDPYDLVDWPGRPDWNGDLAIESLPLDRHAMLAFARDRQSTKTPCPFQLDLLDRGSFSITSPFSGRPLESTCSLVSGVGRPFVFYRFCDGITFFVIAHPFSGGVAAIYLPERNLLIGDRGFRHYQRPQAQFKALVLEFAAETAAHVAFTGIRPLGLLFGATSHVGHTALNEYSGLNDVAEGGRLGKVDLVLRGPFNFLPHGVLFPELGDREVVDGATPAAMYEAVVERRMNVVRPTCGWTWFSGSLTARLAATAVALGAHTSPRPDEAAGRHPLIWFEVRTNDRCWLGQADGIAAIVTELAKDHPDIAIVVAGWSRPPDSLVTPYDEKMLRQDRAVADAIRARIDPAIPLFDLTGLPTSEKLLWATQVDLFAGSYSTGLIYALYTGLKPGVIHCTRTYLQQLRQWGGAIPWVEWHPKLYIVSPDEVTFEESRSHEIANYEVNWRAVYEGLVCLLADPERRRVEATG